MNWLSSIVSFVVLYGLTGYLTNCQFVNIVIRNVKRNILVAANRAASIRDSLVSERIPNSNALVRLENVTIPGMPPTVCNVARERVMEIFNESLEKIINLKPYWNLVVRDEERYENGRFESQMNSAIQSLTLLQGTLCNYIHSKTDCNSNITVPQQVLNVTRSMRFMRDYVIARDTVNVILCIYRKIEQIGSHN